MRPGQSAAFRIRSLDANGFAVEEIKDGKAVKWASYIPPTARVRATLKGQFNEEGKLVALEPRGKVRVVRLGRVRPEVREPAAWLASVNRHFPVKDSESTLDAWLASAEASLRAHREHPSRVIVLLFDDLVHRTGVVMRMLCDRMDLEFSDVLLQPTYNSMPVLSDSSHAPATGVDTEVTSRYRELLTPADGVHQAWAGGETLVIQRRCLDRHGVETTVQTLAQILDLSLRGQGVQVFIGGESGVSAPDEVSVVTAPYSVNGTVGGTVGVIGPTRMAYDRVVPIVDVTAKLLSSALSK